MGHGPGSRRTSRSSSSPSPENLGAILAVACLLASSSTAAPGHGAIPTRSSDTVATAQASSDDGARRLTIVQLEQPPLASYRGGVDGLAPTSPAITGAVRLDPTERASAAYRAHLTASQDGTIERIRLELGRAAAPAFRYQIAFNGLALELTDAERRRVERLPGVARASLEEIHELQTDAGPTWIGAPSAWSSSYRGEGVIIGILDTGLNIDHPSFADVGGDGYDHVNPWGPGSYVGLCQSDPASWVCNDKLIGYWIFTGETGDDDAGHGSHVAATAAGNVLTTGTVDLTPYGWSPEISGVAPHANLIAYDVCVSGCSTSAILAAIDQAVLDGVDVVNYSIGSAASDPWTNPIALSFLAATEAGVVVVASAGNSGPGSGTVLSPAVAPWLLTVGNATHDRSATNTLGGMAGGGTAPPPDLVGAGFSSGHGPAPIVFAGDFGDPLCLSPFPPGTWTNDPIVVCDRGVISRVGKGYNVLQGGAGGYVLVNVDPSQSLNGDVHHLPGLHLGFDDGQALKAWLASGTGHTASILGTSISLGSGNGDVMAANSSRGPNSQVDVIKPDLVAPGTGVLAAYASIPPSPSSATTEYGILSGTSMASPHAAGAAALLRQIDPTLTPAEVRSILMTTSDPGPVVRQDGVTPADPFDRGSGRVRIAEAMNVGLLLDATGPEFTAADPNLGGDPTTLNLASMANGECCGCGWSRTFEATAAGTWQVTLDGLAGTVQPASFSVTPGQTQTVTVDLDTSGLPAGSWSFGEVRLVETGGNAADATLPVAARKSGAGAVLPDLLDLTSSRPRGSATASFFSPGTITDLVTTAHGLVRGTPTVVDLSQDPTNGDPFDNLNDGTTHYTTVTVPADAARLVAEVVASAAPDVDLFVGSGLVPSAATVLCSSTTSTSDERCDLRSPAPGDHWILLQSWQQSGAPPDRITMSHAVVGGATGTLAVSGPSASSECTQVDLEVVWHVPDPRDGERWYGAYSAGPDAGLPTGFGTAAVDIVFEDVTHWLFCAAPDAAIPDEGFLESTLSVPTGLFLTDLDVHLDVAHTFVGDLTVLLEKTGGPATTLVDRPGVPVLSPFGCGGDDIDVVIDDDGPDGNVEDQCDNAPAIHGRRRGGDPPASVLASFFGEDLGGDWRLTVFDNAQFDTGTLREWCVEAEVGGLVFADGFESGDTSAW